MGKAEFSNILKQSFKDIRSSRADSIIDDAKSSYQDHIRSLLRQLRSTGREKEDILMDLLPNNTTSTVIGSNFDPNKFVIRDFELAIETRELKIQLEVAIQRYEILFGEEYALEDVTQYLPEYKSSVIEG